MANTFNITIAIDNARAAIEAARSSDTADPATVGALDALLKVTSALKLAVGQG